jgi:hypothetical protein
MSDLTPTPPWSLTYADGAANFYRFEASNDEVLFTYHPVTPERSSTGRYSGGAPRQERLAAGDPRLAALWREVAALEADRTCHAADRIKGDGAFSVTTAAGVRGFLIARAALGPVEALLARFG